MIIPGKTLYLKCILFDVMIDLSDLNWFREVDLQRKVIFTILFFLGFDLLIYFLADVSSSGFPLFLLFIPLVITSSFYFRKWNIIPLFLSSGSLLVLSILYYGDLFFEVIGISLLNLTIFSILFCVISSLIGRINISYRKTKRSEEFLDTIISQDLRSKTQLAQGYLSTIDESQLGSEDMENHSKGLKNLKISIDLIDQIRSFNRSNKENLGTKNLTKKLDEVIHNVKDQVKEYGGKINIKHIKKDENSKVLANNNLGVLFSNLIKLRTFKGNTNKIRITESHKEDEKVSIIIEDDGRPLNKEEKSELFKESYTGKTTGIGGVRSYIITKLIKEYNGEIKIQDSDLGGTKFIVNLKRKF